MSKKEPKRESFIQLYRRKVQHDLDNMGYPGGKETEAGSRPAVMIIDAGSKLSSRTGDSPSRKRRKAMQP